MSSLDNFAETPFAKLFPSQVLMNGIPTTQCDRPIPNARPSPQLSFIRLNASETRFTIKNDSLLHRLWLFLDKSFTDQSDRVQSCDCGFASCFLIHLPG
jgi:hypothetical protein